MPKVNFGRKDDPAFTLKQSNDMIAVRTLSKRSVAAEPVASPAAAEVSDGQLVASYPDSGGGGARDFGQSGA